MYSQVHEILSFNSYHLELDSEFVDAKDIYETDISPCLDKMRKHLMDTVNVRLEKDNPNLFSVNELQYAEELILDDDLPKCLEIPVRLLQYHETLLSKTIEPIVHTIISAKMGTYQNGLTLASLDHILKRDFSVDYPVIEHMINRLKFLRNIPTATNKGLYYMMMLDCHSTLYADDANIQTDLRNLIQHDERLEEEFGKFDELEKVLRSKYFPGEGYTRNKFEILRPNQKDILYYESFPGEENIIGRTLPVFMSLFKRYTLGIRGLGLRGMSDVRTEAVVAQSKKILLGGPILSDQDMTNLRNIYICKVFSLKIALQLQEVAKPSRTAYLETQTIFDSPLENIIPMVNVDETKQLKSAAALHMRELTSALNDAFISPKAIQPTVYKELTEEDRDDLSCSIKMALKQTGTGMDASMILTNNDRVDLSSSIHEGIPTTLQPPKSDIFFEKLQQSTISGDRPNPLDFFSSSPTESESSAGSDVTLIPSDDDIELVDEDDF
ncbi:hypothetical protein SNEBB_010221 [Seison nebaliae]|nr:hypothetical protein SNEBB_010221 [Seison nebaliae]